MGIEAWEKHPMFDYIIDNWNDLTAMSLNGRRVFLEARSEAVRDEMTEPAESRQYVIAYDHPGRNQVRLYLYYGTQKQAIESFEQVPYSQGVKHFTIAEVRDSKLIHAEFYRFRDTNKRTWHRESPTRQ